MPPPCLEGGSQGITIEALQADHHEGNLIMRTPVRLHWSYVPVAFCLALSLWTAAGHPEHTDMTAAASRMTCYLAAVTGPWARHVLPCVPSDFGWFLDVIFPLVLFGTGVLWAKRRNRATRIIFAIMACLWLLLGMGALCYFK